MQTSKQTMYLANFYRRLGDRDKTRRKKRNEAIRNVATSGVLGLGMLGGIYLLNRGKKPIAQQYKVNITPPAATKISVDQGKIDDLVEGIKNKLDNVTRYTNAKKKTSTYLSDLVEQPTLVKEILPIVGQNTNNKNAFLEAAEKKRSKIATNQKRLANRLKDLDYANVTIDGTLYHPAVLREQYNQQRSTLNNEEKQRLRSLRKMVGKAIEKKAKRNVNTKLNDDFYRYSMNLFLIEFSDA